MQVMQMSPNQRSMPQIIALGGHGFLSHPQDLALSRYILAQSAAARPRICYLPQAGGEDYLYITRFYCHFIGLGAQPAHLSLFQPHTADIAEFLSQQDVIYVGGGNSKSMLALWREWGVDRINPSGSSKCGYATGVPSVVVRGRLCAALASAASVFAKKRYGAICRALSSPVGSRTDYSHAVVFWGGGSCAARMKRMYWL